MRETQVRSMGWEDPLEKGMATHSSIIYIGLIYLLWWFSNSITAFLFISCYAPIKRCFLSFTIYISLLNPLRLLSSKDQTVTFCEVSEASPQTVRLEANGSLLLLASYCSVPSICP